MAINTIQDLIASEFFAYVLPFLLIFALSYAFLATVLKDKSTRTIVSVILGALILPFAPTLSGFLSNLTSSFLIVIGGVLLLVVFTEVIGVRHFIPAGKDKEGNEQYAPVTIFQKYGKTFGVVLIGIAILVFIQSGGLQLLGLGGSVSGGFFSFLTAPVVFFVALIALMVWWVSASEKKK